MITSVNEDAMVGNKPEAPAIPLAITDPKIITMIISKDDFFPNVRIPAIRMHINVMKKNNTALILI